MIFESRSSFLCKESLSYFALIFLRFNKMSTCGILYQFGYFRDCKHQICLQNRPLETNSLCFKKKIIIKNCLLYSIQLQITSDFGRNELLTLPRELCEEKILDEKNPFLQIDSKFEVTRRVWTQIFVKRTF